MKKLEVYIVLVLLFGWESYAQNKQTKEYKESITHQQITIDNRDSIFKFHVYVSELNIHLKDNKTYHWFEHGTLQATQGGYNGRLLDGEYKLISNERKLLEKGYYVKGIKEGAWYYWRKNGKLIYKKFWHHGEKEGYSYEYDVLGKLKKSTHYHHNEIHGKTIQYEKDTTIIHHYKHGILTDKDPMSELEKQKEKKSIFNKIFKKKSETERKQKKSKEEKDSKIKKAESMNNSSNKKKKRVGKKAK